MKPSTTLGELAQHVGGEVRGNAQLAIHGVAPLSVANEGEISWVGEARHASRMASTRASAVLIGKDTDDKGPADRIICGNVDRALAVVMRYFAPPTPSPENGIHPTAVVSKDATLGTDVAIGPHCVVESGAVIGDRTVLDAGAFVGADCRLGVDCRLWQNVVIRERCILGDRVMIHANSVIGADGFGYFFDEGRHCKVPHIGGVVIEDDVEIGACSCVDRSKTGNTLIRRGAKIDNLVQVAHNVTIGAHSILCAHVGIAGSARLGDYVVLGGNVGIRDNIELGDQVQIAACSCVPQDVPAGTKMAGLPASEFREYLRMHASLRKLPDALAQLRELSKRVEQVESAADHRPDR